MSYRPSAEQQVVIDTWGQGLAVMAGAGSGKTSTLVAKCAALLDRDPKARICAVSFTERSASDLRAKLAERLGRLPERDGHWVMTIHGLCGAILREFPEDAGFDGDESVLSQMEAQAMWERACDALWFDELPAEVQTALETLLVQESRSSLQALLVRIRDLELFGAFDHPASAVPRDLALLARFVLARYERLKRRRGALDFQDLERGADQALKSPTVQRLLRKRFDLVLVDEFQDTNPVQARIIWRMVREGAANLCVVGDPKQSIYRFRDADVALFDELCGRMPVRVSLTHNFRSRPGILEFCNAVCAPAFEASGLAYEPLTPAREPSDEVPVERLEIDSPADFARWYKELSAQNTPGTAPSVALLLKRIRGSEKWLRALAQHSIPFAVGSGGLYWEDSRVHEMVALLKWWSNPQESLAGVTALRAPWVAVPDGVIDAWIAEDPTLREPFWRSEHPLAQSLAPLRARTVRPAEVLEAILKMGPIPGAPDAESELGAPWLGLWHRCEELSSSGYDFHRVVLELDRAVSESLRERDVPPPRNQGLLQILTIHSSKGLEFDHVILADFEDRATRARGAPPLYWDRERGVFIGVRDAEGDRDKDDLREAPWYDEERRKEIAESKRVFYVAITRARERLTLLWPPGREDESKASVKAGPLAKLVQEYWRAWIDLSGYVTPAVALAPGALHEGHDQSAEGGLSRSSRDLSLSTSARRPHAIAQPALFRPRFSVTEWNLLSRCERQYEWTRLRPRVITPAPVPVDLVAEPAFFESAASACQSPQGPTQTEIGSIVHRALERMDFAPLTELESLIGPERVSASAVERWARSSPLMTGESHAELQFEVRVGAETVVGAMDRVTTSPLRVIDFKITRRPGSLASLSASYQTQMDLYAHALEALSGTAELEAWIVNFSGSSVQELRIDVQKRSERLERLSFRAGRLVAGESGQSMPGPHCAHCPVREICDVAQE